jgi:hypothetical protein
MSDMEFEIGEMYRTDELPENVMNKSGKLEWVSDNVLALALDDGRLIEFEMAVECTTIAEIDSDGQRHEIETKQNNE